jgi:uncharacterized protein YkwD
MNIIDIILIALIGFAVYSGWEKGFIQSTVDLATWLGSFLIAFFLSDYILRFLQFFNFTGFLIRPVLFIVLLVVFSQLIARICDKVTSKIPEESYLHSANTISGVIPGLIAGLVYASLISFFMLSYPMGNLSQRTKDSPLATRLNQQNNWPGKLLAEMAADVGYVSPNNFTVHTKGREIISLPFKTSQFSPRPDLEVRMLELINRERKKAGLKNMTFDKKLAGVATKHSSDMLRRGYFSHYTPEGKGPFDRMRSDRVDFLVAGENLALAQTLQSAHEGLMESPVHKANILHVSFERAGIGILDAGVHGLMVTQNFRN